MSEQLQEAAPVDELRAEVSAMRTWSKGIEKKVLQSEAYIDAMMRRAAPVTERDAQVAALRHEIEVKRLQRDLWEQQRKATWWGRYGNTVLIIIAIAIGLTLEGTVLVLLPGHHH
jgi:hypothetical protein